MPLPYNTTESLQVPAGDFSQDAIAVLTLQGARYGGHWTIDAYTASPTESVGTIETCYDLKRADLTKEERYPQLAMDTALIWINDHVKRHGWRLLTWEGLNDKYGADERPFFILARALIGGAGFTPAEGVEYADDVLNRGI